MFQAAQLPSTDHPRSVSGVDDFLRRGVPADAEQTSALNEFILHGYNNDPYSMS